MGGLTEKKKRFFSLSSSRRETVSNFFYEIEIVRFSAFTSEWPYPRKHCWKRLSDLNKIKFYKHLYHCKKIDVIKAFKWLVLGSECEIYLFAKVMKKKKQEIQHIWHLEIFYIRECFQIGKKGKYDMISEIYLFQFKKILFEVKLS